MKKAKSRKWISSKPMFWIIVDANSGVMIERTIFSTKRQAKEMYCGEPKCCRIAKVKLVEVKP